MGVTEAGEGEDGRIKSAVGIGTLLLDGLGDTIRVSLTEAPENEIPVARILAERFPNLPAEKRPIRPIEGALPYDPFTHTRRSSHEIRNVGGSHVPVVI